MNFLDSAGPAVNSATGMQALARKVSDLMSKFGDDDHNSKQIVSFGVACKDTLKSTAHASCIGADLFRSDEGNRVVVSRIHTAMYKFGMGGPDISSE